jgi:hypothetical protein
MDWQSLIDAIKDFFYGIWQDIAGFFHGIYEFFLNLIPDFSTYFQTVPGVDDPFGQVIQTINWILPVQEILQYLTVWATLTVIYFSIKAFLRWL